MPRFPDLCKLVLSARDAGTATAARRARVLDAVARVPTPPPPRSLSPAALFGLLAIVASEAGAQERAASGTPLHVATSRFEFITSSDTQPPSKPVGVHNGGTAPLSDVRLTRLTYADSARGSGWLFSTPRQSSVAPDELATIGVLCVDATGLPAGTYRATAAVAAREVAEPVAITITLLVKDAGPRDARHAPNHGRDPAAGSAGPAVARCGHAVTKDSKGS